MKWDARSYLHYLLIINNSDFFVAPSRFSKRHIVDRVIYKYIPETKEPLIKIMLKDNFLLFSNTTWVISDSTHLRDYHYYSEL